MTWHLNMKMIKKIQTHYAPFQVLLLPIYNWQHDQHTCKKLTKNQKTKTFSLNKFATFDLAIKIENTKIKKQIDNGVSTTFLKKNGVSTT